MKYIYLLLCLFLSLTLMGQTNYSKLKVKLMPEHNIQQLAELGIEVDHGVWQKNQSFISDFSILEKERILSAGFEIEVLVEDIQQYYLDQKGEELESRNENCNSNISYEYPKPDNFQFGTMLGYYRYEEMLAELEEMHTRFPNLISQRQEIDTFRTHQDHPIYWLRISSNVKPLDQKSEVLYTALHHAREPMSLTQLIYFMWYVLENYEQEEEIKYLLDNTALYFIPCVNPDGYLHNESTNPQGAGFWRKNLRDNDKNGIIDGQDGVDLNRNYAYKWGSEFNGSSSNPLSAVYRGETPFSEPETQAVAAFCKVHNFQIAMNYHSYGNLLIHPWSYSDQATEDEMLYTSVANAMTKENNYRTGTPTQTVGYHVNGDANDWMYGAQEEKGKIFSFIPEVGRSFWPPMSEIEPNCQANIHQNLTTAHLTHAYATFEEESSIYLEESGNELKVNIKNIGLQAGTFKVSAIAIGNGIADIASAQVVEIAIFQNQIISIPYEVTVGTEEVELQIIVDNLKGFAQSKIIQKRNKKTNIVFEDTAENLNNWNKEWGITTEAFYSAPSSFTDSPNGNYQANGRSFFQLETPIDLTDVKEVRLQYRAKWYLEPRYDNVQVQLNLEDQNYIPLCGQYSTVATEGTWFNQAVYNGFQEDWVFEDIDLTSYLRENSTVLRFPIIRFAFTSDEENQYDGFYLDDIRIVVVKAIETRVIDLSKTNLSMTITPNPINHFCQIHLENVQAGDELLIYNIIGQLIEKKKVVQERVTFNSQSWENGIYFCQWRRQGEIVGIERFIKT